MRNFLILMVVSSILLGGCGRWRESSVNPSNWFGDSRSTKAEPAPVEEVNPLIPEQSQKKMRRKQERAYDGTLVDQVTELSVEPTAGGAIIRVTGMSARQGAFDVRLTSETEDKPVDGVLTFALMAVQPQNVPQGLPSARTLTVAKAVGKDTLEGVTAIRVVGARNVQTSSR